MRDEVFTNDEFDENKATTAEICAWYDACNYTPQHIPTEEARTADRSWHITAEPARGKRIRWVNDTNAPNGGTWQPWPG